MIDQLRVEKIKSKNGESDMAGSIKDRRSLAELMFVLLVVVAAVCWYGAYRYRRRRLYELAARFPGLPELPFIGHAHYGSGDEQRFIRFIQSTSLLAMKNNGISKMWLGPLLYTVLIDPVDAEMVLKSCLEKDDATRTSYDIIGYGVTFAPVSIWRRRRKILARAFNPRILDQLVEVFAEHSDKLSQQLADQHCRGPFRAWPFLSTSTFDTIYENAMGMKIYSQENTALSLLTTMNKLVDILSKRISRIWLQPNRLFKLFPEYKEWQIHTEIAHDYTDKAIKATKEQIENNNVVKIGNVSDVSSYSKKSFLELLIEISGGAKGYTNVELREEIITLFAAATDSTAVTLGFILLLLAKYPDVQEKLYQELCDVFGNTDRLLVKEDLLKLEYTERVVKESLRLFPPVPCIIRKVDKETILPSGRVLPAGSGVLLSIWGAHRDPAHWGPDADHFDPDRFLPERYRPHHACSFMPFSNGPRNCVGYQYAMASIKTTLSTLLRRYRVLGEPERGPVPHIDVKFRLLMTSLDDFKISIIERN